MLGSIAVGFVVINGVHHLCDPEHSLYTSYVRRNARLAARAAAEAARAQADSAPVEVVPEVINLPEIVSPLTPTCTNSCPACGQCRSGLDIDDAASRGQLNFQTPATQIMEKIVDLHHDLMFFIVVIVIFVS